MRVGLLLAVATACGRVGFEVATDDAPPVESPPPPVACQDTLPAGARIQGSALEAVATAHGLAALWIDLGGALRGTTWTAAPGGVAVVRDGITLAPGPFLKLWVAAHDDQILVATQGVTGGTVRLFLDDLTPIGQSMPLDMPADVGRSPIAARRDGPGFVGITVGANQPAIYHLDGDAMPIVHLYPELMFHAAPSIAPDATGYAVVTELADQYGPGCWYSKLNDNFAILAGPGFLESTQQADCDSSTVTATAGPAGAGMAWMDRDPVNAYVEYRGTSGVGGAASSSGEIGTSAPVITATSTGFALLYRSTAGLRIFDASGTRTLTATPALADLVTWTDRAIVVWTTPTGTTQLTRLCP